MDARSISLLQESVARLILVADQADTMFNARLLDTYPEVYRIFAIDVEPDERRFVAMTAFAVDRLHKCGALLPTVRELMRERKVYRIALEHYAVIGLTLQWTLRRTLGPAFTAEIEDAWLDALQAMPSTMIASTPSGLRT